MSEKLIYDESGFAIGEGFYPQKGDVMNQPAAQLPRIESTIGNVAHYGVYFVGAKSMETFWQFKMPCGHVAAYAVNALPTVDTPCPCGDPTHWIVKIGAAHESEF